MTWTKYWGNHFLTFIFASLCSFLTKLFCLSSLCFFLRTSYHNSLLAGLLTLISFLQMHYSLSYLTWQYNHVTSPAQRSSVAPYCLQERRSVPVLDTWLLVSWCVAPSQALSLTFPSESRLHSTPPKVPVPFSCFLACAHCLPPSSAW